MYEVSWFTQVSLFNGRKQLPEDRQDRTEFKHANRTLANLGKGLNQGGHSLHGPETRISNYQNMNSNLSTENYTQDALWNFSNKTEANSQIGKKNGDMLSYRIASM